MAYHVKLPETVHLSDECLIERENLGVCRSFPVMLPVAFADISAVLHMSLSYFNLHQASYHTSFEHERCLYLCCNRIYKSLLYLFAYSSGAIALWSGAGLDALYTWVIFLARSAS